MTAMPVDTPRVAHEHTLRLVQVDYDETGRTINEYECSSCGVVWFD